MATTLQNYGDYSFMRDDADEQAKRSGTGIFARLFATFIASREAWAKDAVDAHLSTLPDAELGKLGLSVERIGEVRSNVRARQTFML